MHEFILLPYVHKVDEAAKHSWDIIMAHPFIMHFIRKKPQYVLQTCTPATAQRGK